MFKKRSHSVSGPSSSGTVVMEGVLEKKKTFGLNRFHCMLREGKLWYSEDKGRENFIDISHAQSVREGKAKFSFEIITSSRTRVFVAESQALREKWMSSLREVMRVSSRKMSIQAHIEDDEDSVSKSTRSSLATNSPMDSALKPGVVSTLPPALASGTPAKSFEKEGFFDTANLLVGISELVFKSQHGGIVAEKSEREDTRETAVEQKDDGGKNSVRASSAKDLNLENEACCRSSKGDAGSEVRSQDVNSYESVLQTANNFQAKELTGACDRKEETFPPSKGDLRDDVPVHTSSSLYANNADIERFLGEQKSGTGRSYTESAAKSEGSLSSSGPDSSETVTASSDILSLSTPNVDSAIIVHAANSLYANDMDIERSLLCEQKLTRPSEISRPVVITSERSDESLRSGSSTETAPNVFEFPDAWSSETADESCDQVFPLDGDSRKVVIESSRPPMAVQRRSRASSIGSVQVDSAVVPEPVEVELEADFVPTPIPDLPHPCLDSNRSSAIMDILSFLSDKMKADSFSGKKQQQQPGRAVECLKHFLHTLDDI